MSKHTLQERLIAGLEAFGETRDTNTRCRGAVYTRTKVVATGSPEIRPGLRYFVGENGAIRLGKSRVSSRPLNDSAKERLLAMGTHALQAKAGRPS